MNLYSFKSLSAITIIIFLSFTYKVLFASSPPESIHNKLEQIEISSNTRIGVSAINTANDMRIQYRANERFPFCSTFKLIGVAAILNRSTSDHPLLQQKINFTKTEVDLAGYAPITKNHIIDGMTISDLCAAAIEYSDNLAINLLIKKLGGLSAVTNFARSIDDNIFRLDRWEPELNSGVPGDKHDTTTPAAMRTSIQKLVLGNALASPQREQLQIWLTNNTTGNARIRAGLPKNWIVGDKTGTGDYGTTNDIAIIWPPHCKPIVMAIYVTQNKKSAPARDDVIASIARITIHQFANNDPCIKGLIK